MWNRTAGFLTSLIPFRGCARAFTATRINGTYDTETQDAISCGLDFAFLVGSLASKPAKAVAGEAAEGLIENTTGRAVANSVAEQGGTRLAPQTAGLADDVVGPSVRYNRATHYGGAQTNSPAARALREGAEGTACPSCGRPQISGTNTAPVPEHSPSLLEHYYGGGHAMTDAQRRAYAQSADAFDGTMCLTCQRSQGGSLSQLSRWYAELWGL